MAWFQQPGSTMPVSAGARPLASVGRWLIFFFFFYKNFPKRVFLPVAVCHRQTTLAPGTVYPPSHWKSGRLWRTFCEGSESKHFRLCRPHTDSAACSFFKQHFKNIKIIFSLHPRLYKNRLSNLPGSELESLHGLFHPDHVANDRWPRTHIPVSS